jgi:hypothetical protein
MEALADQTFKLDWSLIRDEEGARARLRETREGEEPSDEEVAELLDAVSDLDSFEIAPHQNQLVVMALQTAMALVPYLLSRHVTVLRFPENGIIVTDDPIYLFQRPENRVPFVGLGPANADELWIPLDRRTGLILHTDDVVGDTIMDAPPDFTVDRWNQAIVSRAHNEAYCHPEDVERLDFLDFPDRNRPLFEVMDAGSWLRGSTDGVNTPPERRRHHRYRRATPEELRLSREQLNDRT